MSTVVFIAASGHTLLVVHVLPDSTINEEKDDIIVEIDKVRNKRSMRGNIMNTAICRTKSGWVTKKSWRAIIDYFSDIAIYWLNGRQGFLTMDRLAIHGDNDSISTLKDVGLECFYFPAKTSHFLQPLDQTPFAMLKRFFKMEFIWYSISMYLTGKKGNDIMRLALIQAEAKAYTHANIRAGFAKSGVFPWNPKKIIETTKALSGKDVDPVTTSQQEEEANKKWNAFIKDHFETKMEFVPKQTRRRRIRNHEFTGSDILERDLRKTRENQLKVYIRAVLHKYIKKQQFLRRLGLLKMLIVL